jgi:Uma2 family endonuclease
MLMSTQTKLLTLEDYAAWEEPENEYVTELVKGVVVREPRPGRLHARVQFELAHRLKLWLERRETGGGEVLGESGFILSDEPATVRGPDVSVLLTRRESRENPGDWIRRAPDVAVEVLSPSDRSGAMQQKIAEYLEAGALRVWIVDPRGRTATIYRPDGSATLLRPDGTLEGEDVLPGFALPLADLFGEP